MEDNIISVVEIIAGQDVLPLIDVLKGKKNVSEFSIAEELKEEINTIRNKLYRLYDSNLVEFTRKKDKKKGWYIYYWTFVPSRIPYLLKEMKKKEVEKLKQKLVVERSGHFFTCENECTRQTFEKAMDHQFKCPECGGLMNQQDNTKKIEHITKKIQELEKEIQNIPDVVIPHHEHIDLIEEENGIEKVKIEKPKIQKQKLKIKTEKVIKKIKVKKSISKKPKKRR